MQIQTRSNFSFIKLTKMKKVILYSAVEDVATQAISYNADGMKISTFSTAIRHYLLNFILVYFFEIVSLCFPDQSTVM